MKVYACIALLVLALSSAAGVDPTGNSAANTPASTPYVTTTNTSVTTINTPDVTTINTSDVTTTNTPDVNTPDVNTTNTPDVNTTNTPDVNTTNTPDVNTTNAPDVNTTNAPDVNTTNAPDVNTTNAPDVDTTNAPDVNTTNAPDVNTTNTPDVDTTNTPDVNTTNTPDVTTTKAPDVTTTKAPDVTTTKAPDVTTTKAPDVTTTKAPTTTSVVISETNLLLHSDEFFIELQGSTSDSNILNGLTLVIFDGTDGNVLREYNTSTLTLNPTTGLAIQSVDTEVVQNLLSVAVVLYPPGVNTSEVEEAQDFVCYATGKGTLAKNLAEIILPHRAPLPMVSSHGNLTLSMTRSGNKTKDNSAFVMAPATRNQTNNLTLSPEASATLQLTGNDCNDIVNDTDVLNTLVGQVNKCCQCGMSTQQIVGNAFCQKDYFFNFSIIQSYEGQSMEFATFFKQYVNRSNVEWPLQGKNYSVVNCTQQCWTSGHHLPPPTDGKSGNIKVTVAVVLSCIVVFLLILVAVIFYMRSKRQGIMRQFRMTRLQEDDDMDDMDNFMGGIDQEPDFSSSRNNLTG